MTNFEVWELPGGVTAPRGFLAAGVAAGIKDGKKDLALVLSEQQAAAAGVFTTNKVQAAPVQLTARHLQHGQARAVVVNSGNANACNGPRGMEDARAMAEQVGRLLEIAPEQVLVGSTGVIGQPLPLDKVLAGIEKAAGQLGRSGGSDAAQAIITTDTCIKEAALGLTLNGVEITLGGMAKGSGMIHPAMATMLCFITTDAAIEPDLLHKALLQAVESTFNMITVDGDTSTNDMVLVLANGAAGNPVISHDTGPDWDAFCAALEKLCRVLAVAVAQDGEGATKLIEVQVQGGATVQDARSVARTVAASSLVKAAVYGQDANWGRILCAAGYARARFNPDLVDIFIGDVKVAENGGGLSFDEEQASRVLAEPKVIITIDLKNGSAGATAWGCDLTYDYVRINASYRS